MRGLALPVLLLAFPLAACGGAATPPTTERLTFYGMMTEIGTIACRETRDARGDVVRRIYYTAPLALWSSSPRPPTPVPELRGQLARDRTRRVVSGGCRRHRRGIRAPAGGRVHARGETLRG